MHGADQPGLFDEGLRRPKGVEQIGAATLEFSGQRTIQDDDRPRRQQGLKRTLHDGRRRRQNLKRTLHDGRRRRQNLKWTLHDGRRRRQNLKWTLH
jgi:hypothetical protein